MNKKYRLRFIKNIKSETGGYYYIQEIGSMICEGIKYAKKEDAETELNKLNGGN